MLGQSRPDSFADKALQRACESFVEQIGLISAHTIMREGILKAAICALTKALESEFDGYQDVLIEMLRVQSELIARGSGRTANT
jgi:hypothetical protein